MEKKTKMGKKLAIQGHSTRGKEVIELLEMLGGINKNMLSAHIGDVLNPHVYFLEPDFSDNRIVWYYLLGLEWDGRASDMMIFTLEEFLEKYPFKIGDKVTLDNKLCSIIWMCWECNDIYYQVQGIDDIFTKKVTADELKPYIEPKMKDDKATGSRIDFSLTERIELDLGNTHEVIVENGKTFVVRKKPTYPNTPKECCEVLNTEETYMGIGGHKGKLLQKFQKLLICRDAYWKIYGEEIGLGKPWEPNWTTFEGMPAIFRFRYNIVCDFVCDSIKNQHCLLVFPTVEMRNAFYENFKDLIEQCRELL